MLWKLRAIGPEVADCHRDKNTICGLPKSGNKRTHGTRNGALHLSALVQEDTTRW